MVADADDSLVTANPGQKGWGAFNAALDSFEEYRSVDGREALVGTVLAQQLCDVVPCSALQCTVLQLLSH